MTCAITKTNLGSLDTMPSIAKELRVDAVKFEHLNFLSNSELKKNRKFFTKDEYNVTTYITDFGDSERQFSENIISKLNKIKKDYTDLVLIKPNLSNNEIRNWYSNEFHSQRKCFFIWHSIFIRPDGIVIPCQFLNNYELGSITEHKLQDIFRNNKMRYLRKLLKRQLLPGCSRCCKL